jgi:hypothetical protein
MAHTAAINSAPSPVGASPLVAGHIREFDGLRGLAILAVLAHHFWPTGGWLAEWSKLPHLAWIAEGAAAARSRVSPPEVCDIQSDAMALRIAPAAIHLDIPTNQLKPSRQRLPRARFRLGKRGGEINRRHRDPHRGRVARLLELHRRGQLCPPPRMQLREPRRLPAKLKVNLAVVSLVHERHARRKCGRAEVDEGRSARPRAVIRCSTRHTSNDPAVLVSQRFASSVWTIHERVCVGRPFSHRPR